MKKILLSIVIFIVLYIIIVFKAPIIANQIEKIIWLHWLNEKIRNIKNKLDYFWTKVPTKNDLQKYYSWTLNSIDKTKENIDKLRKKADELKNTYDKTKNTINQAWEKLNQEMI